MRGKLPYHHIKYGSNLTVTDEGSGIIRIDASGGAVSSGGMGGSYEQQVLTYPSLLAYWPLSDAASPVQDVSGDDHHFDGDDGAPVYGVEGPLPLGDYPNSVYFNGTAQGYTPSPSIRLYKGLAPGSPLHVPESFTMECWVRPDPWATQPYVTSAGVFQKMSSGLGNGGLFFNATDAFGAKNMWFSRDGNNSMFAEASLSEEVWTHVVGTYDYVTGIGKLYYDGVLMGEMDFGTANLGTDPIQELLIGESYFAGGGTARHSFNGRIAHVAMYSEALPEDVIQSHAAGTEWTPNAPPGYVYTSPGDGTTGTWTAPTIEVDAGTVERFSRITLGEGVIGTDLGSGELLLEADIPVPPPPVGPEDTHAWMPLSTVVGGDPELVWGDDNSLIPTFTPL